MKFAYADPPYLGMAKRYADQHPDALIWDDPETHRALIDRLCSDFDGWALSLNLPSLRVLLPMCPPDVRVMAWCKSWCSWKPGAFPKWAWEPVFMRPADRKRKRRREGALRVDPTDWLVAPAAQNDFFGAKPPQFTWWVLACLGVQPNDSFEDLFPGSGAVGRAWEAWRAQLPLEAVS